MKRIVFIVGTTASGKSDLGIKLARRFNGEIISADSRQVYKGFDLGSGKVTKEEQSVVPHHLLDVAEPNEVYSAAQFQQDCYKKIEEIFSRGKNVFIVGGTGLYTRAVAEGYSFDGIEHAHSSPLDEKPIEELQKILKDMNGSIKESDAQNKRRLIRAITLAQSGSKKTKNTPRYDVLQLGCDFPKEALNERMLRRIDVRVEQGMIEEVKNLLASGVQEQFLLNLGLDYGYITRYIKGEFESYEMWRQELFAKTRQFAKRQRTWFKKEKNIVWLDMQGNFEEQAASLVQKFLAVD